ncbi:hypothetical protein DCAR_0623775 [Daucus carota subsp. sativus]|uniref:Uncharacterized protein n=1 Tax=Daucus carota subsp. sativus TaxID=79200 RepID=A0A161ZRE3_DAUCS|nr:hypothetical protein DCAR_0623775 [Daucus carota subsp. sativus]
MSSRRAKRKRYLELQDVLVSKVQSLNLSSSDLDNDVITANEDFGLMYKSMEDRQSELYSRMLGIAEKSGELHSILKYGKQADGDSSSTEETFAMPEEYKGNVGRFIEDSRASVNGHAKLLKAQITEMYAAFEAFVEEWTKKLKDLKEAANEVGAEHEKLSALLTDFILNL